MKVGVIGTGYVGLQSAQGLARKGNQVFAYDLDKKRIESLLHKNDKYHEVLEFDIKNLTYTCNPSDLSSLDYYLICVPTPVDKNLEPCISMVIEAAKLVGSLVSKNNTVICESTVYPGVTEGIILPILENTSGLKARIDFHLGFSSERINPGDELHRFNSTAKVYAGIDQASAEEVRKLYETAIEAPLFEAANIKAAEASKLLENVQRDVNIALMNEFAQVMDSIDIRMGDVIDAAATKWNFVPFKPGFVGGHCIAVDPYYLIHLGREHLINTDLMDAARRTNDQMLNFVEKKLLSFIEPIFHPQIAILGLTYKKNIGDFRNSLALKLYKSLSQKNLDICAVDPFLSKSNDINNISIDKLPPQDLVIICVAHNIFLDIDFKSILKGNGVLIDLPGIFRQEENIFPAAIYWTP